MPDWFDTPAEILAVLSIGGVIVAFLSWLISLQRSNNYTVTTYDFAGTSGK